MTAETKRYLELLERRITLLDSLATALLAARADVTSFDIDGLEARITQQERLCTDIRTLDSQLDRVQSQCAAQISASSAPTMGPAAHPDPACLRETLDRLTKVQAHVQQLNDAHQALLRRSRRTIGALLNSYHSFAMTYSDPNVSASAAGERL